MQAEGVLRSLPSAFKVSVIDASTTSISESAFCPGTGNVIDAQVAIAKECRATCSAAARCS